MIFLKLDGWQITKAKIKKNLTIISQIGLWSMIEPYTEQGSDFLNLYTVVVTLYCRLKADLCDINIKLDNG